MQKPVHLGMYAWRTPQFLLLVVCLAVLLASPSTTGT